MEFEQNRIRTAEAEILYIHITNLQERADAMEARATELAGVLAQLATKSDLHELAESVQGMVALLNHGTGLYKFVIGLGAFVGALGGILFGIHQIFTTKG